MLTPRAPCRRPARFNWWRADWNPITWDAEEWFVEQGHAHAPWVEHTLALIGEGWDNLNNEQAEKLAPVRVPPPTPQVLNEWEIYVRQQVDARLAREAAATAALQATIGEFTRLHHDTHNRDIRVARRKAEMPNYRPRSEWSEEEIRALIACPPAVHQALITGDPRFKVRAALTLRARLAREARMWLCMPALMCDALFCCAHQASYRDLRPYGPDELEHLAQIGRLAPDGMFDAAALASASLADMMGGDGVAFGSDGEGEGERGEGEGFAGADELQAASADELAGAVDIGDDDF